MQKYNIKITVHALSSMLEIAEYIAYELKSPQAASNTVNTIRYEIKKLEILPNRVALTDEEPWRSQGIHKMSVGNYLVYFWIDESDNTVKVLDVVYARREQRNVLQDMPKQLSISRPQKDG